jgi:hypothetical protein
MITKLTALFFTFMTIGCQTYPAHKFNSISLGMEKGEVIEQLGSPKFSNRRQGVDRWIYHFYQYDKKMVKEIHFQEGKVIYLGDETEPTISAEEQDRINQELNKKLIKTSK